MDDHLWKELLGLPVGEPVTVDSDQYVGDIIEIERGKCYIVLVSMEEGCIKIYLNLNLQTMDRQKICEEYLITGAKGDAPNDFESPTANLQHG
jgi:hypothetical protein